MIRVTQLLSQYTTPFDETGVITARCAKKDGVSVEEKQKEWKDKADLTSARGSALHKVNENFLREKRKQEPLDNDDILFFLNAEQIYYLYRELEKLYPAIVEQPLKTSKMWDKFLTEEKVTSHWLGLEGTADVVFKDNHHNLSIFDIKTYETLTISSKYNEYFKKPIDHLQVSKYNTAALQLALYGVLLEEKYEIPIKKCGIIHIDYELNIHCYYIPYMKHEALELIKHYINNK